MTKLQISAELMEKWSEAALAASDATDLLTAKALTLLNESEPNAEAIRTLLHASRFAGIGLPVFARLAQTEARIALNVGEKIHG